MIQCRRFHRDFIEGGLVRRIAGVLTLAFALALVAAALTVPAAAAGPLTVTYYYMPG